MDDIRTYVTSYYHETVGCSCITNGLIDVRILLEGGPLLD